ncbi:uncharacterized protein BHQ10_003321 [Talaromyces amestolkiae]|uniref:Uncharacterized protein n=1 Tax=Talaromyces amestolkiae TaxID=1196081 RepID=A0A364KUU8_TALAM|nr:uncharacterized protein BHQ10_003321 [Talaromyces amestolkiae]RAO67309.1 hypothetical protein BHQ10_003321 [Talaromyces amestolkiae]
MPRLISTLSRILKFILYSYLTLIGLWAFLPSVRVSSQHTNKYISDVLKAGELLHTVYPWDRSFEAASVTFEPANALYPGSPRQWARVRGVPSSDCTHVLADWKVVSGIGAAARELVIGVGRDLRTRLNLTDAALKVRDGMLRNENVKTDDLVIFLDEDDGRDETVYISDTITVQVDSGGRDHIINLPWFSTPDAAWFHNQMHGFTYDMDIRLVARQLTADDKSIVVEIWKSAPVTEWLRLRYEKEQLTLNPNFPVTPQKDGESVKFVKNMFRSEEHYSKGLLASFVDELRRPHLSHSSVWDVRMTFRNAELTTRTYWIRSALLFVLAPILMVTFALFENLIEFLSVLVCTEILSLVVCYCVVVLVSWVIYNIRYRNSARLNAADGKEGQGRKMGFLEWSAKGKRRGYRSDEKRGKRVVIWGPSGPVYEDGG